MSGTQLEYTQLLRTPAGAVATITRIRQNNYVPLALKSLTTLIAEPECWRCLRDAGVVNLFVDMILQIPPGASDDQTSVPLWALPLQGLFNSLVGIQRSPGAFQGPENREATLKILKTSPVICHHLYGEKDTLCSSETYAEDLRRSVNLWIQAIWTGAAMLRLTDVRRELKDAHIIDLSTWCWLFASSVELHSKASIALADVLEQPQSTKEDYDQAISSAGSYDHLIKAFHRILQDSGVADEYLANNLSLLTGFTGQTVHIELGRRFAEFKTHHEVMAALRRQMTRPIGAEEAWRVLEYSGILIVNIVNEAGSPTDELTNLIAHHSLIPLLGVVSLRCAQASKQSASWSSLITLLKHTCTCTSPSCRVRTAPSYVSALRTHMSWRWWPTLKRMQLSNSESSTNLQSEWVILGRMGGLKEATERKRHGLGEGVLGCWWVECLKLVEPSDPALNTGLRKCSGCKKALYCTNDCQNRDWKTHKKQCAVWKTAIAARWESQPP